jgi:acetolactate synthase-1/2/3 large subunit
VILVGAARPVAFFAYPGNAQMPVPEGATVHVLARPDQDVPNALSRLAERLDAHRLVVAPSERVICAAATGEISSKAVAHTLTAVLHEHAIIVDESISFGREFFAGTQGAAPHDWLQLTGGAIGAGIPMATGAAIGAPGRRVVNLQADGSALYTGQGLWTQAREKLDVTTVILSNREYAILLGELTAVGANPGRVAFDMMSLDNPAIDWVSLAMGYGVEAAQAETMPRLAGLLVESFSRPGPFLIELVIPSMMKSDPCRGFQPG